MVSYTIHQAGWISNIVLQDGIPTILHSGVHAIFLHDWYPTIPKGEFFNFLIFFFSPLLHPHSARSHPNYPTVCYHTTILVGIPTILLLVSTLSYRQVSQLSYSLVSTLSYRQVSQLSYSLVSTLSYRQVSQLSYSLVSTLSYSLVSTLSYRQVSQLSYSLVHC
jgi:hypothetical protein